MENDSWRPAPSAAVGRDAEAVAEVCLWRLAVHVQHPRDDPDRIQKDGNGSRKTAHGRSDPHSR